MVFIPAQTTDPASLSGTVTVLGSAMPGGTLAWTVSRRLAGASQPLHLVDTLGDGQQFDAGFTPVVTLWSGASQTYSGAPTRWSVRPQAGGVSLIDFDLSGLPTGSADRVSVTFHSTIAAVLHDGAQLRLIGQGDSLSNSAVLTGQAGAPDVARATLPGGSLTATVYALNGVPAVGGAHAAVGDTVTYRLHLHLPLSTARQVQIVARPPDGAGSMVFDGGPAGAVPPPGHAAWGPDASYVAVIPVVSADGDGIHFQFGDLQPVYGVGMSDIDLLFTTILTGAGGPPVLSATETEANANGAVSQSLATTPIALDPPHLTVQTASLYASGAGSQFAGSGGPWGFDIFTSQFGGVVGSAGLAEEPFRDSLWDVDAGDVVTFVVAVQNLERGPAYDVLIRDAMPAGFAAASDGLDLSVTDGAGTPLGFTGSLFDPASGLRLAAPLAGYDAYSGLNVALLTFSLQASARVQVPRAALSNRATIVSYAALPGGDDVSGRFTQDAQASTAITTAAPVLDVVPDQVSTVLNAGQQAQFDVRLSLPEGEISGLRIEQVLPHAGGAWLGLVSAEIIHVGSNLSAPSMGAVQPDGSIAFGTVSNTPDGMESYADQIVMRLTVRGAGIAGGDGVLRTVASATDPNVPGGVWSSSVTSMLTLVAPDVAPTIAGARAGQNATTTMQVQPFSGLALADPDAGQVQTLRIQLANPAQGVLYGGTLGSYDAVAGVYQASGSVAAMQAEARRLLFSPSGLVGMAAFTVTLDDGAGGVARDSSTQLELNLPSPEAAGIQRFAMSPTGTVLTATAGGGQTVAQIESYQGPVDYLQSQFIYDGTAPLAIVAQSPDVFIKSVAGAAAVQLLSGRNVVDAGHGSNFLLGGTGTDVFFLDGRQAEETWDTIVGFHAGDIATLWGFQQGVSRYWWEDEAGAPGFTGRTLRADLTGSGHIEASLTFAGQGAAETGHYVLNTGNVGGNDYLAVFNV